MDTSTVLNKVVVLFLIMVVGFVARKRNILTGDLNKKLSQLLLNVTLPFLIINSFNYEFSKDMLYNALIIFIFSVAIHGFSILAGFLLFKKYPIEKKSVLQFATVFSNCAFMGFPVLKSVFEDTGTFYGSIYNMVFNIFLWTYGVILFSRKKDTKILKKAALNPGIISVVIGMLIFLFSIKLPGPILETLDMVGSMTVPISMLIIGSLLAETRFTTMFNDISIYFCSLIRLVILPLLVYGVMKLIGISDMLTNISVLLTAMPVAATTAIFAEMFDADSVFASKCVAVSTLLSIVTIPLILMFL